MDRYRFLLSFRWILSHLFVLAVVITMINLGFWQLRRLHERKAMNATITAAWSSPAAPIDQVLPSGVSSTPSEVKAAEYRIVTVTGTYLPDQEVLIRNRNGSNGSPGFFVLTPLRLPDGTAVAINRGWVPYETDPNGSFAAFDPPPGKVTVTGMLRTPEVRSNGLFAGPKDNPQGVLRTLSRADVARLDQQVPETLVPAYVDLQSQQPAQSGALPDPPPRPVLSDGPHLSYAGQWFIFTLLTLIVYPLLLRRVVRNRNKGPDDPDPDEQEEGGPGEPGPRDLVPDGPGPAFGP